MMDEYFKELTNKIEISLLKGIDSNKGVLEESLNYSLSVKGKRLRPLLFLTLIDAFGKEWEKFLDIAAAIEYIHTYSLIHDDLPAMDNDDFRRGMPTVHKQFNEAIALLAGDTLLTLAFEKISFSDISAEKIRNIIKILTVCIGKDGMAGGQVLDLGFEGDRKDIFTIHRLKTADFIKGILLSAAEVVEMEYQKKEILSDIGITIGIAFQMADDLLDVEGDEKEVGKRLKKDQLNESPNSVLFYGKDYIKNEIDRSYQKVVALLKEIGITHAPFLYLMEKMVYRSK